MKIQALTNEIYSDKYKIYVNHLLINQRKFYEIFHIILLIKLIVYNDLVIVQKLWICLALNKIKKNIEQINNNNKYKINILM